jgi:hypothetical protein
MWRPGSLAERAATSAERKDGAGSQRWSRTRGRRRLRPSAWRRAGTHEDAEVNGATQRSEGGRRRRGCRRRLAREGEQVSGGETGGRRGGAHVGSCKREDGEPLTGRGRSDREHAGGRAGGGCGRGAGWRCATGGAGRSFLSPYGAQPLVTIMALLQSGYPYRRCTSQTRSRLRRRLRRPNLSSQSGSRIMCMMPRHQAHLLILCSAPYRGSSSSGKPCQPQ